MPHPGLQVYKQYLYFGASSIWDFPKHRALFGSPCNEDHNVLESNLGPPTSGNLPTLVSPESQGMHCRLPVNFVC